VHIRLSIPTTLAIGIALVSSGPAKADGNISMDIAGVDVKMTTKQVIKKVGPPANRTRVRKTLVWRYPDRLTVYLRRKRPNTPRRVTGVRTRSPKDKAKLYPGLEVGAHVRRLHREDIQAECFTARVADPTGKRNAGRYCSSPTWHKLDPDTGLETNELDYSVDWPVWIFRIKRKRIASITLQRQPYRYAMK
jgi:hypothetical protein